ncbi:MAG: hypothetical protein HPY66_1207 [Firmicutes bacterium]|nr:hypothetical protein [Bacillota bacterium]
MIYYKLYPHYCLEMLAGLLYTKVVATNILFIMVMGLTNKCS